MLNKEKLTEEMMKCLDDYEIPYRKKQMAKYIDSWSETKSSLISILSKHPNWNWRQMAVSFDYDTERSVNVSDYKKLFWSIVKLWGESLKEVTVCEWDELVRNETLDSYGNIIGKDYEAYFNGEFKYICGRKLLVARFYEDTQIQTINPKTDSVLYMNLFATEYRQIHKIIGTLLKRNFSEDLSTETIEKLNSWGLKCTRNQKFSRILNKFFGMLGITSHPEYNKLFAQLSDAINPIKVTRHTLLSVHPCDFLNMSNGNSWTSCHFVVDGGYKAGTLSYMLDGVSMVFYTVSGDYNGETMWDKPKINRQMFMYNDNALLQSRLYPDYEDGKTINDFREIVQKFLADCLNVPNLWVRKTDDSTLDKAIKTKGGALHYTDYTSYERYDISLSILKEHSFSTITIGEAPFCFVCGNPVRSTSLLTCISGCENADWIPFQCRIKENLEGGEDYGDLYFAPEMEKYRGISATVIGIEQNRHGTRYKIQEDECRWEWSAEMFEEDIEAIIRNLKQKQSELQ